MCNFSVLHVQVSPGKAMANACRNRHDVCSISTMLVVGANYKIYDVNTSGPGSRHDSRIFEVCRISLTIMSRILFTQIVIKVEKIEEDSLDLIPSPSHSVKIQIMGGKVCLRCKGKTLLGVVNKLLKTKSLLTIPSNVLPLQGEEIESRLPFKIFSTLTN